MATKPEQIIEKLANIIGEQFNHSDFTEMTRGGLVEIVAEELQVIKGLIASAQGCQIGDIDHSPNAIGTMTAWAIIVKSDFDKLKEELKKLESI